MHFQCYWSVLCWISSSIPYLVLRCLMNMFLQVVCDSDGPLLAFSLMTAPHLCSGLFPTVRGGCRFVFLYSTTDLCSELLFGRLGQLLSFFSQCRPYVLSCFLGRLRGPLHSFYQRCLMLWADSWSAVLSSGWVIPVNVPDQSCKNRSGGYWVIRCFCKGFRWSSTAVEVCEVFFFLSSCCRFVFHLMVVAHNIGASYWERI